MTPEAELRARVERGASYLDQHEPRWWKRSRVRSQLLGTTMTEDAKRAFTWSNDHGFVTFEVAEYDDLDRLWVEAIEARRADPERYVP